jgi:hypothetical protein
MCGQSVGNSAMSNDMSIFFFHVRRGDVLYLDREGVELPDLEAARAHAEWDAKTALRDATGAQWIEIDDGKGTVTISRIGAHQPLA